MYLHYYILFKSKNVHKRVLKIFQKINIFPLKSFKNTYKILIFKTKNWSTQNANKLKRDSI